MKAGLLFSIMRLGNNKCRVLYLNKSYHGSFCGVANLNGVNENKPKSLLINKFKWRYADREDTGISGRKIHYIEGESDVPQYLISR